MSRDEGLPPVQMARMAAILFGGVLLGSATIAFAQHSHGAAPSSAPVTTTPRPAEKADEERGRLIQLTITDEGFQPAIITARKGERIRLVLVRLAKDKCTREFCLDEFLVWRRLPLGKQVTETFVTSRIGDFPFECPPSKETGVFRVED